MKIMVNTASTFKGGGVQVAHSFIEECKKFPENEYHVVLGTTIGGILNQESFPDNFKFYKIGYRPATKVFSLRGASGFFKQLESKIKPDAVFTTSGPAYWRPKAPHVAGYNLPHYVYPDSPFMTRLPFKNKVKWNLKGAILKHFFNRDADAYVVQTEDVNQRLKKYLGTDKVYTVTNTFSAKYLNPKEVVNKLPVKKNGEFRLLTLSAWYPHKNIEIIKPVVDALREKNAGKIKFVLTLPQEIYEKHFPDNYRKCVINIGPVKIDEAPSLYNECDAMFLPTLLECFSASYAEAMVMQKPILTSDMGFAHTVCHNAALYFNPVDPADIADKIIRLYNSAELQQELINKGNETVKQFGSAQERAAKYLEIITQVVNGREN